MIIVDQSRSLASKLSDGNKNYREDAVLLGILPFFVHIVAPYNFPTPHS